MGRHNIELTPAMAAYLAAFDNWLHTIWKQAPADRPRNDLATGLKNAALAELMRTEAPRASARLVAEMPALEQTCKGCGAALPERTAPGRPRKYCHSCRPAAKPTATAA